MKDLAKVRIAVLGLGYVGLPLAVEFAKHFDVVGYDISTARVEELQAGIDSTLEVPGDQLAEASRLRFSFEEADIRGADVFIVTAPTPIDQHKRPDLGPVLQASAAVGRQLTSGAVVIYESTVYPGATQEDCVPVLEKVSGLTCDTDFFVGYSPERINPGDHEHRLPTILKITSGSTPQTADFVDALYRTIITAGTYPAPSIRVAEAAKVIENTQRDVNIALMNELAVLFERLEINTQDVLKAAGTKWNFLPFTPGLVGGHCIGVDPYYLTHKAQSVGHHPEMILAGRRINDSMGPFVARQVVKGMACRGIDIAHARVLVLGATFKENTPDLRNSRVGDVVAELQEFGVEVEIYDPWVDKAAAARALGIKVIDEPLPQKYDGVVHAVAHRQFGEVADQLRSYLRGNGYLFDVKGTLPGELVDGRL